MTQNMYVWDLDMYVCFVIHYMPPFMIVALTLKDSRVKLSLKCVIEQYIQEFLEKSHKGKFWGIIKLERITSIILLRMQL